MLKICIIQQAVLSDKKNYQTFFYKIRKTSNLVLFMADTSVVFFPYGL